MEQLWKHFLKYLEKTGPTNDEDASNKFLKTLDMRSISTRKHEWNCGNMDQYLFENMKWNLSNMGSISSNKSRDGQCSEVLERAGQHKLFMWWVKINGRQLFKEMEALHGGISLKSLRA